MKSYKMIVKIVVAVGLLSFGYAGYSIWQEIKNNEKRSKLNELIPHVFTIKQNNSCGNLGSDKMLLRQLDPWLANQIDAMNGSRENLANKELEGTLKLGERDSYLSSKWVVPNSFERCQSRSVLAGSRFGCTQSKEVTIRTCKGQQYSEGFNKNGFCEKFVNIGFYNSTSFENIAYRALSYHHKAGTLDDMILALEKVIKKDAKNKREAVRLVDNFNVNKLNTLISKKILIERELKKIACSTISLG